MAQVLATYSGLLTPADDKTHRRWTFDVPEGVQELHLDFSYEPKAPPAEASARFAREALDARASALEQRAGLQLATSWRHAYEQRLFEPRGKPAPFGLTPNMLTLSLDDADGAYRGAAHRHDQQQHLELGLAAATPGLLAGALPAGTWSLTLSAHGVVSNACTYWIQIGAVTASSLPEELRASA